MPEPDGGGASCAMDLPMVLVSGGMGQIGSVSYTVNSFYLDLYEVTVGAYRACLNGTSGGHCTVAPDTGSDCNWTSSPGMKENHPINCVDWNQATTFCAWADRRLPTEGEWAYAAFGPKGMVSNYPWGTAAPQTGGGAQLCWDRYQPRGDLAVDLGTCPVGGFPKTLEGMTTASGVADLAGNVWEWTSTQYESTYGLSEIICSNDCSIRGGSWSFVDTSVFGPAGRFYDGPAGRNNFLGFRCARSAP